MKTEKEITYELSDVCQERNIAISYENIGRYLYVWGAGGKLLIEFKKLDDELTLIHSEINIGCTSILMKDLPNLLYRVIKKKRCN